MGAALLNDLLSVVREGMLWLSFNRRTAFNLLYAENAGRALLARHRT